MLRSRQACGGTPNTTRRHRRCGRHRYRGWVGHEASNSSKLAHCLLASGFARLTLIFQLAGTVCGCEDNDSRGLGGCHDNCRLGLHDLCATDDRCTVAYRFPQGHQADGYQKMVPSAGLSSRCREEGAAGRCCCGVRHRPKWSCLQLCCLNEQRSSFARCSAMSVPGQESAV